MCIVLCQNHGYDVGTAHKIIKKIQNTISNNPGITALLCLQVHTPTQRHRRFVLRRRLGRHCRESDLLQAGQVCRRVPINSREQSQTSNRTVINICISSIILSCGMDLKERGRRLCSFIKACGLLRQLSQTLIYIFRDIYDKIGSWFGIRIVFPFLDPLFTSHYLSFTNEDRIPRFGIGMDVARAYQ